MKSTSATGGVLAFAIAAAISTPSAAQSRSPSASPPPPSAGSTGWIGLRTRFGADIATRLMRSTDADERLRGIERAAAIHTPEALSLLERAAAPALPGAADPHGPLEGMARRSDPRALLAVVRGLAAWVDLESARTALAAIVGAPTQSFATRAEGSPEADSSADDEEGASRVVLARQTAAIALAESGNLAAIESLIALARSVGPGQAPALDALAIYPPPPPLLGGVVLTTPSTIALAVGVGDLRSLDAIEVAMSASDPALRAAALTALGIAGDSRVVEAARAALHDRDARVRLAACDSLVRLGAPDAAPAVEALVADDATVLGALHLAELVQSEGVTKAAAARAMATANVEVRAAAVAALGRQASPMAIHALATLSAAPMTESDAAYAIARSPSPAALAAIDTMAETIATRRVAARAYAVRRLIGRGRNVRLDAVLAGMSASHDARDRAVGMQALVALGERSVDVALGDPDARVRRAAAMGAFARWDAARERALLARLGVETDEATKQVLALALVDGDPERIVPTTNLRERTRAGGPDAPLAALALAQRAEEEPADEVDALLRSHDSVLRAHSVRGLGASLAHDVVGRLARAYATEGDVNVRRAIIGSLSTRTGEDAFAPLRRSTLELAARLDPDRVARWTAARALEAGSPSRLGAQPVRASLPDVAWVRIVAAQGADLPRDMTAAVVANDGLALPIAFDEDGYALLPGVPAGEARLRLAPRPAPYEAPSP
jgi:HEAT repeat protein